MAVTRSWERESAALHATETSAPPERRREFVWLATASLLIICGLALVGIAKTQEFSSASTRLDRGELLNLNTVTSAAELLPFLQIFSDPAERATAADRLFTYLQAHHALPNVGTLARLRISRSGMRIPLLPVSALKPLLVVRTPREFWREYVLWTLVYLGSFWLVHVAWRLRRFRGDPGILPALHLLTDIGLILAVSLRDPLRDTLEFRKFSWGVALGGCLLLLPLLRLFHYQRFARWIYTPLLLSFSLFVLLLLFGSGPAGSDARVNLGPFQPVEAIKILLVFFMAGYFAKKWEWLRELTEKKLLPRRLRWLSLPRVAEVLPVMCGVSGALLLFFLLKDLGPALVTGILFLTMFAVARKRSGLALLGLALLIGGVVVGYHVGKPQTVVQRVSIWQAPWDNDVPGGDQLAHALWAFATGGVWGSGPGWGDPGLIPAGHTDLVLPAIAEEWGFAGVLSIVLLFVFLLHRAFRIALGAPDEYAMFLSLGLGTLIAFEMLLISGGVLGAIPLSGVVSPFLSSGNTAMLANFLVFSVLAGISNQPARAGVAGGLEPAFLTPVRALTAVLGVLALSLVARAVWLQVLHADDLLDRDARVIEGDGVKRPQPNPRLSSLARAIPRGTIYDRSGLPLAASNWELLEQHRPEYEKLGISIDQTCSRLERRHYPLGAATAHLLGDLRTRENFQATNASLIEHDLNPRLQGFSDLHELAAFVRHRHQPAHSEMQALLSRNRDVRSSIDARLQWRLNEVLRSRLEPAGKSGAAVIMNAATGEVLALASFPEPTPGSSSTPDQLLDRARYGQYPPGSTFKLVTAMAALRHDPALAKKRYECHRLRDARVGTTIPGWNRPIRDDVGDHAHGSLAMEQALTVSCNAYFAQLGTYDVGAQSLWETADLLGIPAGDVAEIRKMMPFSAYGQGPVLATPFKMARVAAAIAEGGLMAQGRWVMDDSNSRNVAPRQILAPQSAQFLAQAMRTVVTSGTGRQAMAGLNVAVAGKTGTAQVNESAPHSWFVGFAPYDGGTGQRIAFAVVVEHGGYGSQFAAPIARQIVEAARDLGIVAQDVKVTTQR